MFRMVLLCTPLPGLIATYTKIFLLVSSNWENMLRCVKLGQKLDLGLPKKTFPPKNVRYFSVRSDDNLPSPVSGSDLPSSGVSHPTTISNSWPATVGRPPYNHTTNQTTKQPTKQPLNHTNKQSKN